MNNLTLKGLFSMVGIAWAFSATAQQIPNLPKQSLSPDAVKALQKASPESFLNNRKVKLLAPRLMQQTEEETTGYRKVMKRDAQAKPGTFYSVESGYYNLVPGFGLAVVDEDSVVFSRRGILGYTDRDLTLFNRTPKNTYSAIEWDFYGEKSAEDTIKVHPYFANNRVYMESPKLTATMNGADSTYQMGYGLNLFDESSPYISGMVALSGMAYVYNVDVDATPLVNTFYTSFSSSNPWGAGNMFFGWDTDFKPAYLELYDAPAGGAVALMGTHFYVLTPTNVDLAKKRFSVSWAEEDPTNKEWNMVHEFKDLKPQLNREMSSSEIRVWEITATMDEPDCLVKNKFYVMIAGPQDGTKWALLSQLDRMNGVSDDQQKNTAYYIPTVGEFAGQFCQYVFSIDDGSGEQVIQYATSLDIHQYVVTPYMVMCKDNVTNDYIQDTNYDFSIDGETQKYLILDWMGGASNGTSISAKVSNSTDGDWVSVTQPVEAEGRTNLFALSVTAQSKPWNVAGRRATLTLTDNKGFSRELVIYQGDREEADKLLSIKETNASGKINVTQEKESIKAVYPTSYQKLNVYSVSGQLTEICELPSEGEVQVSTASWAEGIYLLQFVGAEGTQTVKIVKK